MRFFGVVATLLTATSAVLGEYCGAKCDASKVPKQTLSAPLQLVAVVDQNNPNIKYEIGGNVIIKDDCHFSVENFYFLPGGSTGKWMGSRINSNEGMNLSTEDQLTTVDPNDPKSLTFDVSNVDMFCKVSLLNDVGRISLVDSKYQVLAYADVNPALTVGASAPASSTSSGAANKVNNANTGNVSGNASDTSDATTAKWSMGLLGLASVMALLLA